MAQETTLVGLDVGTSKVACVVAKVGMDGKADIVGIGQHAAHGGLQKGVVVNIEATAEAIRQAVQEAEMMGDVQVRSVLVGIAGQHISGMDSHGVVRVKGSEVSEEDVARVIEAAKAVNLPADRRIVHVLEQEYVIDGQGGVREPVGMSGVRLEAQVYLITAAASAVENLMRCCKRCGLYVEDVVLQQLASAEAVLSDEEREMGVAVVDIGEGTTDIIVIARGGVRHVSSLPVGGGHLTNDLMAALRTSRRAAEAIKRRYGAARAALVDDAEVEVPGVGGRPPRTISRQQMVQFLEMRVDEMFELVRDRLQQSGFYELIPAGIVLTGGASAMPGMVEAAEDVVGLQARLGRPAHVGGLADVAARPELATAVGLVLFGTRYRSGALRKGRENGFWTRLVRWFTGE